jgi:hypothetical protein
MNAFLWPPSPICPSSPCIRPAKNLFGVSVFLHPSDYEGEKEEKEKDKDGGGGDPTNISFIKFVILCRK